MWKKQNTHSEEESQVRKTISLFAYRKLGVLLDKHLTWKEYIKLTEKNCQKNTDILYKARPYLDKRALLCLCYSYSHSYLNYANTPW